MPATNPRHEQARHDTMAAMLQAASLRALPRVRHAFFTREGGVSDGVYASLNGGGGARGAAPPGAGERARRAGGPRGGPGPALPPPPVPPPPAAAVPHPAPPPTPARRPAE